MRFQHIVAGVAAVVGMLSGQALAASALSTTLQVESRAGQVLLHVTIHNRGRSTLYIPRALAADPHPLGKTFMVTAGPGATPVPYTGPMVKRGPIGPADFVAVKPHSTLRHTLDISRSYGFLPGAHSYTLQYAGAAVSSLAQLDRTVALAPAPARFTHTSTDSLQVAPTMTTVLAEAVEHGDADLDLAALGKNAARRR